MSALLIAAFLPAIVIGLFLAPFVDRLSRRRLLIGSDLVRAAVFCVLPFATSPGQIVALAAVVGIATGLFRPAVYAGIPNLVEDPDLEPANALLQSVESVAWMIGPVAGGLLLSLQGPESAYWLNALSFLVSALLLARIPAGKLQVGSVESRGHLRDIADGLALVVSTRPLLTVLIAWSVVMIGNAGINVAEVALAKVDLDGGDLGFGVLVGAGGVGLTVGSYLAPGLLDRFGPGRLYSLGIALMGVGYGIAAAAPNIYAAVPAVILASLGNGAAVVCNALLVQRGAPDDLRGRAFTVIMSTNYALLGLAMIAAGPATDALGARWVWALAAAAYAAAAVAAAVISREPKAAAA